MKPFEIENVMSIVFKYLNENYSPDEVEHIKIEIEEIMGEHSIANQPANISYSYEQVQEILSSLNEKENIRKSKGVYYTPSDVVSFIIYNSFKLSNGMLKPDNLHVMDLNGVPFENICYRKRVFDPTCGAGEFLLNTLETKLDLLDLHFKKITKDMISEVLLTIHGNDINPDSIILTKVRIFLTVLKRYGVKNIKDIAKILNKNFYNYDYVCTDVDIETKYDIILGNPPYVEDSKSGLDLKKKYGNIYANVLDHASKQLSEGGTLGFIIPLSYVATPRMKKIRDELYDAVPEQYLLNYSDRPDCLFTSVHQKLSILFARKKNSEKIIYTGNYTYWYKDEREGLFSTVQATKNNFVEEGFIPKIGSSTDANIYRKITRMNTPIESLFIEGNNPIYLNMRATFWIKAFLNEHKGSEYKKLSTRTPETSNFVICLLNSSLFWWYWICVSDCWHITKKELRGFKVPEITNFNTSNELAVRLENKLEETKLFVGTKQTEYEYKHKRCIDEIHAIDDYINELYGLTLEESLYIKSFAYRYRVSGGASK